ncbi:peptidase S9 prolyl oligopeptidase active site domain protein [Fibrella aestuarina BUZ 2]|uniref:Peptidase S9 prolyl oligopeptidase active site domain protein n=1 Tax=Fibrella aestuarina BUZ 2 TaxID=1166018 RepID=I0K9S0_9BACT|nr:peptidase S9 prolyl oligopeptidase active site domain protein [Fibrella aestuarina BUZ 2]
MFMQPDRLLNRSMRVVPLALVSCFLFGHLTGVAQDAPTYQTPPKALADLVTVPLTPSVSVSDKGSMMLILEQASAPGIAELAQPELKLAGLRLNPANNGPSRMRYVTGLKLKKLTAQTEVAVTGLPAQPLISYTQWSPDETKIAFANSTDSRIELYVVDVATAAATKVGNVALNATMGSPFRWLSDSKSLIVKAIPAGRGAAPEVSRVPAGPTIQANIGGKRGQAPTYQDLLKSASDERQFSYYTTAQVMRVALDGQSTPIGQPGIIASADPSPDGNYVMIETVHTPFSYLVPVYRFPLRTDIYATSGTLVKTINDGPLHESVPYSPDGAPAGPRDFNWRADAPASVYYTVAQDNGDPKVKADVRDKVFLLDAPFAGQPKEIYAAQYRFEGFEWGNETMALATEQWWQTRKALTKTVNPKTWQTVVLFDRSYEDRYGNPGQPDTRHNQYGRNVLNLLPNGEIMMVNGQGASPEGDRPFVSLLNLNTKQTRELWRSQAPYFERPVAILDAAKQVILTTRETPDENPNYFVRNLKARIAPVQVTQFAHPYPQLKGVQKQQLRYKRADGVDLTATLYLPVGYKKEQGPLPTFLWAYPAEFKSKDAAGQVSGSPYQFNRISYWGAAAFVTMGYAILDNASIPIVGEGDKEPNDTYVEQLVSSAKAAIDEGVRLGVVDSTRVGVGGHSYGAFMTANLLTYSKLFRAGIARSGAYNRTLTPFGFQNEQRTYWQAPDVYNKMSPFMNADKVKTPILLVHGEADNNTGTFPIQSERYYNALKSFGVTTKFVLLPYESHGYTAKESLLHMLAEMNTWLDTYVKNPKPGAVANQADKSGSGR